MDDYKEMYCLLFNKITDIIKELQEIQQQTEKLYMTKGEIDIKHN